MSTQDPDELPVAGHAGRGGGGADSVSSEVMVPAVPVRAWPASYCTPHCPDDVCRSMSECAWPKPEPRRGGKDCDDWAFDGPFAGDWSEEAAAAVAVPRPGAATAPRRTP